MKLQLMRSFFYAFLLVATFSCSSNNNDDVLKYTTDSTLGLSRINLDNIADKIPVDKILKEKKDIDDDEKFLLQLINKPKESGIAVDQPFYVIVDPGKSEYEPQIKALFEINDKEKFQKSMSEITKSKVNIDKKNYIYVDGELCGSIKGKKAVITKDTERKSYRYEQSLMDSTDTYSNVKSSKLDEKFFADFWDRKATTSKSIKDQVSASLTKDKDVSGWINLQALSSYLSKGYIETLAVNKLIKESGVGFDFDFQKGSAEMDTKTFFNNDMKKIVEKYYDKNKINYDLVQHVDLDNASSYSIGFFSLDFMHFLIKESGFEATINNYLSSTDKTLADITSTFTGDYSFVEMKTQEDSTSYYTPERNVIILGINKKKADNLKTLMEGPLGSGMQYVVDGDKAIFSDDEKLIYEFKNKKTGKNSNLKKKSGITSYSWSDGGEYNKTYDSTPKPVKIIQAENESKEEKGNLVSKTIFTLDKKDENALYYFIMNG